MCSRYTYNKDEAKLILRDQILVFGFVPRGDILPTDLEPVRRAKAHHSRGLRLGKPVFYLNRRAKTATPRLRPGEPVFYLNAEY
jgi:hypothetical protein